MPSREQRAGLVEIAHVDFEPDEIRRSYPICADLLAAGVLDAEYEYAIRRIIAASRALERIIDEYPGCADFSIAKRLLGQATRHATNGVGLCRGRRKAQPPGHGRPPQPCPID